MPAPVHIDGRLGGGWGAEAGYTRPPDGVSRPGGRVYPSCRGSGYGGFPPPLAPHNTGLQRLHPFHCINAFTAVWAAVFSALSVSPTSGMSIFAIDSRVARVTRGAVVIRDG